MGFLLFVVLSSIISLINVNCISSSSSNASLSSSSSAEQIVHQAAMALPPNLSPLSRILNNAAAQPSASSSQSSSSSSRIHVEAYKAMAGETVRFECPQANPTWFFRRINNNNNDDSTKYNKNSGSSSSSEDLIVTRHGVINADYKYRIMCHSTLKHKVIIINNIDFDEEGLYTCLYTAPANEQPQQAALKANSYYDNNEGGASFAQFRYVFNLTVYTPISGLVMNVKLPAQTRPPLSSSSTFQLGNKKIKVDHQTPNEQDSLTVRENDELNINCVVESSRPAADVRFSLTNSNDGSQQPSTSSSMLPFSQLSSSIVSSSTNIIKNADRTFKTVQTSRVKASIEDHGKVISCKAENGFSQQQKWESRKVLNVLFAPVCKDPPNTSYFIGINQTLNVECRIQNANPIRITYEWNLNDINGGNYGSGGLVSSNSLFQNTADITTDSLGGGGILDSSQQDESLHGSLHQQQYNFNYQMPSGNSIVQIPPPPPQPTVSKSSAFVSDAFTSRFKWKPSSMNDFGVVRCKATNDIGTTECIYELKLGGVPNPPADCTHTLKNTSAIISCQVGFHQGDPDIYCYLLRKTDNGVYKEHTRNRESCSFIVNDVNVNKLNEFWVYSSNKHGHNKEQGVYLTIGQSMKQVESNNNRSLILIAVVTAIIVFLFLVCCFCFKIRKGLSDADNDSVFEADAYHLKSKSPNSSTSSMMTTNGMKKMLPPSSHSSTVMLSNNFSSSTTKMLRGVKINNYDKSYETLNEKKVIKIDMNHYNTNYKRGAAAVNTKNIIGDKQYSELIKKEQQLFNNSNIYSDNIKLKSAYRNNNESSSGDENKKSTNRRQTNNNKKKEEDSDLKTTTSGEGGGESFKNNNKSVDRFSTGAVNNNVNGVGALVRNKINTNNNNNNNSKNKNKSISFTKTFIDDDEIEEDDDDEEDEVEVEVEDEDEEDLSDQMNSDKELTPLFNNNNNSNGLLIASKEQMNSQKMVTFGSNNLINATQSRKTTSNEQSTTASSASPATSSTTTNHDEMEIVNSSNSSPIDSTDTTATSTSLPRNNNCLTVSDQSNNNSSSPSFQLPPRPNLSTFSSIKKTNFILTSPEHPYHNGNNNSINYRSPKRVLNCTNNNNGNSNNRTTVEDILEAKYLNKLCEEIEVSLNVDCECADDYSSNDFSGDYSFDTHNHNEKLLTNNQHHHHHPNHQKSTSINNNGLFKCDSEQQQHYDNDNNSSNKHINNTKAISTNISHLTDLRKNFEQNIKQLRGGVGNSNSRNNNSNDSSQTATSSAPAKKNFGVLV